MIKDIYVKEAKNKGKGIFTARAFKKNEFIFRSRRGKSVKKKDIRKLPKEDRNHLEQIAKGVFEVQTSPERYINHSCDPNTIAKGKSFFALKRIKKGEEITTDYRISALKEEWKMKCCCGTKKCIKIIKGDFFTLNKKLQKKYLPYAPKFIQEEYKKQQL